MTGQSVGLAARSSFARRRAILLVSLVRHFPAPTVGHSLQAREEQGPWPTVGGPGGGQQLVRSDARGSTRLLQALPWPFPVPVRTTTR
jgi:hypothetical protein